MAKYRNRKVTIDGITFDSKHEADRYRQLQALWTAGQISHLELQKKFVLVPAQYETFDRYGKNGKPLKDGKKCVEKEVAYYADFTYITAKGEYVVEDAKGVKTKDYIIKRKLMLFIHDIKVKEV
jgi:hypothetical protein